MAEGDNNSSVNTTAGDEQKRQEKNKGKGGKVNVKAMQNIIKFISTHIVVIGYVALALLIIIFVIGILQILITMPGLILGKIKEFVGNFFGQIAAQFNGDTASIGIDEEDEKNLATYIQEMGYDLEGFGFGEFEYEEKAKKDEEGNEIEGETKTVVNSVHDGNDKLGVRGYLRKYLVSTAATYAPAVWHYGGFFKTLFSGGDTQDESTGMIRIKRDGIDISNGSVWLETMMKSGSFKILPEKRALQIKVDGQIYHFDMSDWTSKYGKPMELFLALHLSTMMPDLTYDLATSQAFNTKVTIDFQTVKSTYKIKYNGYDQETILRQYYRLLTGSSTSASGDELFDLIKEARKSKDKIKPEDWDLLGTAFEDLEDEDRNNTERKVNKIIDLIEDGRKERTMYWPRITEVTKHWYYETIIFEYGRAKGAKKTIIYSPDDTTNPLYGAELEMETTMTSTQGFYYQLAEPERKGPNEAIVALFKGGTVDGIEFPGEYYRYDGTKERAQKINNARAIDNGGSKYLFMGKEYDTEPATVFKEPVVFYDVDNKNSNKNAYAAFAMLEKAHSEEAEVSYRCLKELLIKLEYFTEEELQDPITQALKWIIPDMELKDRKKNVGKDANLYGIVISNASGQNIIAPGDGTVIESDGDSVTVEFGKLNSGVIATLKDKYHIGEKKDGEIQLYKLDENILVGLQMVIVGINPSVSKGQTVSVEQSLGTATGETGKKVQVYFKRADGSVVDDIEKYLDVHNENFKKE